jgi:hypothetical protein
MPADPTIEDIRLWILKKAGGGRSLIKTFKQYDTNGDGSLSAIELQHCLKPLLNGMKLNREIKNQLLRVIDKDQDGRTDYKEFVVWVMGESNVDKDGDGNLTETEIAQANLIPLTEGSSIAEMHARISDVKYQTHEIRRLNRIRIRREHELAAKEKAVRKGTYALHWRLFDSTSENGAMCDDQGRKSATAWYQADVNSDNSASPWAAAKNAANPERAATMRSEAALALTATKHKKESEDWAPGGVAGRDFGSAPLSCIPDYEVRRIHKRLEGSVAKATAEARESEHEFIVHRSTAHRNKWEQDEQARAEMDAEFQRIAGYVKTLPPLRQGGEGGANRRRQEKRERGKGELSWLQKRGGVGVEGKGKGKGKGQGTGKGKGRGAGEGEPEEGTRKGRDFGEGEGLGPSSSLPSLGAELVRTQGGLGPSSSLPSLGTQVLMQYDMLLELERSRSGHETETTTSGQGQEAGVIGGARAAVDDGPPLPFSFGKVEISTSTVMLPMIGGKFQ